MKLQATKRKDGKHVYTLVIPKHCVELLKWEKGNELDLEMNLDERSLKVKRIV